MIELEPHLCRALMHPLCNGRIHGTPLSESP